MKRKVKRAKKVTKREPKSKAEKKVRETKPKAEAKPVETHSKKVEAAHKDPPKQRKKRTTRSSKRAVAAIKREGKHIREFYGDNGETYSAVAWFRCNILQRQSIRAACATGTCGESGCPFFRNEEDQELVMEYMDDKGKTKTLSAEIVYDKKGNRKLRCLL